MKLSKKGNSRLIGIAIAAVTMIVCTVIIGNVENGTTWTQTLSGTIGDYVEPLAMLAAFALIGSAAYVAVRRK